MTPSPMTINSKIARYLLLAGAIVPLVFAVGYYIQAPWAISTWPAQTKLFTHTFLSAMLVAIAAPMIWIGLTQEWGAIVGGSLNLIVMLLGFTVFTFQLATSDSAQYSMNFPVVWLIALMGNIGLVVWGRRHTIRDTRPLPRLAHLSFIVFALVLIGAGGILVLRINDRIIPWSLQPDTAVLMGWIYLGNAVYFIYSLLHSYWGLAVGPLLSFLTYDLVLLPRLINHFGDPLESDQQIYLAIYNAILIYSALLALYYLFIRKDTRLIRRQG